MVRAQIANNVLTNSFACGKYGLLSTCFPISPIELRPWLLPGWPACSLALVGLTANPAIEEVDGQFCLKDFHLACDILHFKAESKAENEHFRNC
jgi:hypothetical protein